MGKSALVPGYPAINKPLEPEVLQASGGPFEGSVNAYVGYAVGTVAIGGSFSTGNTVTVTINGHPVVYTLVSGDTTSTLVAAHVAAAIGADSTDAAIVTATPNAATIKITSLLPGAVGNYSLTASATGGTIATASDVELDFQNNLYVAKTTFAWRFFGGHGAKTYYQGVGYQIDPVTAAAMRAQGYLY